MGQFLFGFIGLCTCVVLVAALSPKDVQRDYWFLFGFIAIADPQTADDRSPNPRIAV